MPDLCPLCGGPTDDGHQEPEGCMVRLSRRFPTLDHAAGLAPWHPADLDAWAAGPLGTTAARHAIRFVLAVWDRTHRSGFVEWAMRPW